MAYVEFLRVRRTLVWCVGILAVITFLIMNAGHNMSVNVNGTTELAPGAQMRVPLGALAPIATLFAGIYATIVGGSLNRESLTRDISWTKPISRAVLALQYVLIDVAGIALYFALAMSAILTVMLWLRVTPVVDATFVPQIALGLGGAMMWYGLIQFLTFGLPSGGQAVTGILWPGAFAAVALAGIPGPIGALARLLDIVNPIAYMNDVSRHSIGADRLTLWQLPIEERSLVVWLLAAVFCALAITFWPRKEA